MRQTYFWNLENALTFICCLYAVYSGKECPSDEYPSGECSANVCDVDLELRKGKSRED